MKGEIRGRGIQCREKVIQCKRIANHDFGSSWVQLHLRPTDSCTGEAALIGLLAAALPIWTVVGGIGFLRQSMWRKQKTTTLALIATSV